MRKLKTTDVSTSNGMPVKSGTLDHLQLAYQEALTALAKNIIQRDNDTTRYYILFGCVNSGSGLTFNISAGAILFFGEVFLVDAVSFTAPGGQTAIGNVVTTYEGTNADPVTFTDGVARNVHEIRKIVFSAGVSGTGAVDFSALLKTPLGMVNDQQATLGATYNITFDQNKTVFFGSATVNTTFNMDLTNAVPGCVVFLDWLYGAGRSITINNPTGGFAQKLSGNLGAVSSNRNVLSLMYVGPNSFGQPQVYYRLTQV